MMRLSILFHHCRMPAYNSSSFFALFFILHLLINTYIFMSVFLAVVYNNYKKYLKVPRRFSATCWPCYRPFSVVFSVVPLCGH